MKKQVVLCLTLFMVGSGAGFFLASTPAVYKHLSNQANLTTVEEQPCQSYAVEISNVNSPMAFEETRFVRITPDIANLFLPSRKSFQSNLDLGVARALSLTAEEEKALNADIGQLYRVAHEFEGKNAKLFDKGEQKIILIKPYFPMIEPEFARLHTRMLSYLQVDIASFLIDYVRRGFDKVRYGELEINISEIEGNRCRVVETWTHQNGSVRHRENVTVDDFLKRFGHLSPQ